MAWPSRADHPSTYTEAETPMTGRVSIRIPALAAVLALALAVPAIAQTSPTTNAYGGKQGEVLNNFSGGGENDVVPGPGAPATDKAPTPTKKSEPKERGGDAPVPTPAVAKGELPFTGFEAGLVALFGALLLGSGFAMRRASRGTA